MGPHEPVPPHPSDHTKSERTRSVLVLVLAAVGALRLRRSKRYGSGARGATAVQAIALGPPVNELIDTIFGCYPSSKAAGVVPKAVPTIWHKSTARHLAHALKTL
jgi:hypothetical protein